MRPPAIIERYRSEINAELESVIDGHELPLYNMMKYHLGWTDEKGNPAQKDGGKALRPALCLFSCEASGGDYRDALPAAAAVELVHNFSLIHDDVQDDDRERRHRPTVWVVWGKPQAINAGTAMRILANNAVERLLQLGVSLRKLFHINRRLDEMSLRLIEGQYLDISFEDRYDITVNDYIDMIEHKTGALIEGSMELGAYLGTNSRLTVLAFKKIGMNIGLAFQIRDDILGIWGNETETGKPSGNDIRRRKKSFPFVYTLENCSGIQRKELLAIYQQARPSGEGVEKALEIFEAAGVKNRARQMIEEYCADSNESFNKLDVNEQSRRDMEEVLRFLNDRSY
jgi:geranylgeranyl diphosphate synthase, type I